MYCRRRVLMMALGMTAGSAFASTAGTWRVSGVDRTLGDETSDRSDVNAPLIITSNDPSVGHTRADIGHNIAAGVAAAQAGAAILHHHLIYKFPEAKTGRVLDVGGSVELIEGLRERTDALIQLGMTLASNESRMAVARATRVDMFSITLADNEHYATPYPPPIFRGRAEMEKLAGFCLDQGITPEWEIFHSGAAWNLIYLIKKGLAKPPYYVNLTMYPEGSSWAPRTFAEMDHRVAMLPDESIWQLVAFARGVADPVIPPISAIEHTRLLTYAILRGGHVRTGREDRPELKPGVPAESNAQLVREIADISVRLGRPVATPAETRRMLAFDAGR